jgi:hypothetical protein
MDELPILEQFVVRCGWKKSTNKNYLKQHKSESF